ncbi:MAG TPA: preprotein translocase subunit SecE [Actinomycetota bacterium]
MNRQAKRAMQRRERAGEKAGAGGGREAAVRRQRQMMEQKKGRTGFRQFLKEVRGELKKVNWPSRREMLTYTLVVLVTVVVLTSYVFGLDFAIARGVFRVFGLN